MRKTPAAADGDAAGSPAVLPQFDAEAAAAELVEQGQLLQQLPCLADKRAILMRATKLSSTIVCMPQVNIYFYTCCGILSIVHAYYQSCQLR
jgi:hypothetical protein